MSPAFIVSPLLTRTPLLPSRAVCFPVTRYALTQKRARALPPPHAAARSFVTMVAEGAQAPDFEKTDGDGNKVSLSSFRGSRNVVLYFSNGAGPGCTSQSCSFRDAAEDFAQLDAEIIAVSAQSDTTAFKRENSLPFSVIPDSQGELRKLYKVPSTLGLLPGRVTYVIDKQGIVRSVYNSQFSTAAHITTASEALKAIAK
ncbi:unnamed protein product [Chondrus crispus]|uniref:thioredoxin-dependent peroxiredoxin n=1 Tax=Chondrus crispus TaxID=2769 RepID=R7Q704_CHOCR|nr:unnamed protein product [Chondrus crispus]CDF33250.1 unnamed protein product [Chondrus crispus]|eukprot:XP_005713053.1 unnamed protein product [Chondrus crispus]